MDCTWISEHLDQVARDMDVEQDALFLDDATPDDTLFDEYEPALSPYFNIAGLSTLAGMDTLAETHREIARQLWEHLDTLVRLFGVAPALELPKPDPDDETHSNRGRPHRNQDFPTDSPSPTETLLAGVITRHGPPVAVAALS